MELLAQNAKMKKSSKNSEYTVYNFGIPAFMSRTGLKTCPNAGSCVAGCYAKQGAYNFSNVKNAYEERLAATLSDNFEAMMVEAIEEKITIAEKKNKKVLIRVHDSGDFYSQEYADKWRHIASYFNADENVHFYAYTKQVDLMKSFKYWPINFRLVYSLGGKQDRLIDAAKDFHSRVFETKDELLRNNYADASDNDLVTALGDNVKIGLVYHGSKKYSSTRWGK
ncbi:MAG: hypothetical protein GTO02_15155 [Candidatus Dadabacteria bacterium]|nr:hypothetical protein [Candidatus Dadabacteria bacterium]